MLIKYFADIRNLTGCMEQPFSATAPSLRSLLLQLGEQHGAGFRNRIFDRGELSSTLIIMVNGRNIEHLAGIDTALGPDDVVAVFPMVAGG